MTKSRLQEIPVLQTGFTRPGHEEVTGTKRSIRPLCLRPRGHSCPQETRKQGDSKLIHDLLAECTRQRSIPGLEERRDPTEHFSLSGVMVVQDVVFSRIIQEKLLVRAGNGWKQEGVETGGDNRV